MTCILKTNFIKKNMSFMYGTFSFSYWKFLFLLKNMLDNFFPSIIGNLCTMYCICTHSFYLYTTITVVDFPREFVPKRKVKNSTRGGYCWQKTEGRIVFRICNPLSFSRLQNLPRKGLNTKLLSPPPHRELGNLCNNGNLS